MGQSGSERGEAAGSCECGNKPSGFVKCGQLLE
jgi:hypothetical protein